MTSRASESFVLALTRRANHLHIFTIARFEPAPETWSRAYYMERRPDFSILSSGSARRGASIAMPSEFHPR
jgi:hypothetical protein